MLKIFFEICIKMDLALNNLQELICHKIQTNKQTNNILSAFTFSLPPLSLSLYIYIYNLTKKLLNEK